MEGNIPFGQLEPVKRLMTGFFNMNPPKPRYSHTWDVNVVLKLLKLWFPLDELCLKLLTLKLTMLLALVSGQRIQTLSLLDLNNLSQGQDFVFTFDAPLKHSREGRPSQTIRLTSYHDTSLCVISTLKEYISRTVALRCSQRLLISFVKPHKAVTTDTIARWLRTVMSKAGVDTTVFKAHSCRSASNTKAHASNVPMDMILQTAGWSNCDTFRLYYNKPITDYGQSVLNQ